MEERRSLIRRNVFVTRAIQRLAKDGDAKRGIHVAYSDLLAALHLYYGENPFRIIWDLIKKGTIFAEKVQGGLKIYDPKANGVGASPHILVPAKFQVTNLDALGFRRVDDVESAINKRLTNVFDYTDAALICGGTMELHAVKKVKAGKDTPIVDISVSAKEDLPVTCVTVYLGVKRGKVELVLKLPDKSNGQEVADACIKTLQHHRLSARKTYKFKEKYREGAESVIDIILNEKGKLNFDISDAEKLVIAYANEFDKNSCIPRERFREILLDHVNAEGNRGVMATLIRIFTTGECPLLTRTSKEDIRKYHVDGYRLTKRSGELIRSANGDVDMESIVETHEKLVALLAQKCQTEKELVLLEKKISNFVQVIEGHNAEIKKRMKMREKAESQLEELKTEHGIVSRSVEVLGDKIYKIAEIS